MILALLLACDPSACDENSVCLLPNDPAADTLESIDILLDDGFDPEQSGEVATGVLAVTGEAPDWTLAVGEVTAGIHSSARSELAGLDGREVTLSIGADWSHAAVALHDSDGLVYLAEPTDGSLLTGTFLGDGFIRPGDRTADPFVDADDYEITFTTALVQTDEGERRVSPGEVHTLTLGGALYRFVLVGAYTADEIPGGEYMDCGGRQDMLSFELLRIALPADGGILTRPEGMDYARAGCGR